MSTAILEAFILRLKTFSYSPQPAIKDPNIKFNPPGVGMWLEPSYFPNEPDNEPWDDDGCRMYRGFCQVMIGYRSDIGQLAPSRLADAIIAHFPKGTQLGPVGVYKKPWQRPAVKDLDKSSQNFIPVTIPYRGLAK